MLVSLLLCDPSCLDWSLMADQLLRKYVFGFLYTLCCLLACVKTELSHLVTIHSWGGDRVTHSSRRGGPSFASLREAQRRSNLRIAANVCQGA